MPASLGLKILFIEDHDEIRDALASVLESEGFEVTTCATAEDGLAWLRKAAFHLVLTDYSLPEHTGAWMLKEAARLGLMKDVPALLVTAHPNPEGADGIRVIRKPLDLDDFLREVHALMAPARSAQLEHARAAFEAAASVPAPAPVHLVLYISSPSPSSLRALRNLQKLLRNFRAHQVRLTVHDLSHEPYSVGDEDRISFTPTLVKRTPGPRTWIVGDLQDTQAVEDLLSPLTSDPS